MKKFASVISMLLICSMALTACGSSSGDKSTGGSAQQSGTSRQHR